MLLVALIAPASYVSPLPSLAAKRPALPRTGTILLQAPPPPPSSLYEEYLQTRNGATAPAPAPEPTATATQWQEWEENGTLPPGYDGPPPTYVPPGAETDWRAVAYPPNAAPAPGVDWTPGWSRPGGGIRRSDAGATETDSDEEVVPWWRLGSMKKGEEQMGFVGIGEAQRKDRRTIFMHDDWVRHRSSDRFARNMRSITKSGINSALRKELTFVSLCAFSVVMLNVLFNSYQDLSGIAHPGLLLNDAAGAIKFSLPALPFTILMPALSLLLVFRSNNGYSRWNEARTLWGGLINNCRNVVRQSNTYFPDDARHYELKRRMAAETAAFVKALRNFLRGPTDDDTLREELYELVEAGLISREQADATMAASNRPMFCLSAMSATLRRADVDPMYSARVDQTISTLVDLTGANERIFKSPIPLVYTRLTARFLTIFLTLLPLALWGQLGGSWNHWATIPAEFIIAFFLFGIEEVGIQIEEPFSILPLEAFCNGAIEATNKEMLGAVQKGVFEREVEHEHKIM